MKKTLNLWQFFAFAFTSFGGTLLHYLYDWSGKNILLAPFSGVNESTFEHMKLLFFPMFIFALFQRRYFKEYDGYWCVKLKGTLMGLILIPVIFYTFNGVIGKSPDWINIAIFFISALIAYLFETKLFISHKDECKFPGMAFWVLCLIGISFGVLTFYTPEIGLFMDPLTGTYGIN